MDKLYFDYNATTPVAPRVFEAIKPYLTDQWGNPGSAHDWGLSAKSAVSKGRAQVAALINAEPENIIFTSCATESNNLALTSPFAQGGKGRIITQPTEHPAVLEPCVRLQEQGVEVTYLPVDGNGVADLSTLSELLGALLPGNSDAPGEAGLLSLMRANNETGVLQPVRAAAAQARDAGWLVHTDAAQAVAKIPIDVQELGVDYLTIAGHKLYAPKGIGALYVRPGAPLYPLFLGGGQERGLQPGTENVAYIAGLGEACAMAAEDLAMEVARITDLREYFIRGLHNMGADFVVHGAAAERLPGTCSVGSRARQPGIFFPVWWPTMWLPRAARPATRARPVFRPCWNPWVRRRPMRPGPSGFLSAAPRARPRWMRCCSVCIWCWNCIAGSLGQFSGGSLTISTASAGQTM